MWQDGLQLWPGRSCFSSPAREIQGFQQLRPFPSPRGTFHVGAAPEDSPFLTPSNSSFCGIRLIWKQTQVFPEQKICFYFKCNHPVLVSVCGAPSPRVGAERESHHLAKTKPTKEKMVLMAIIDTFGFSGGEAVWCPRGGCPTLPPDPPSLPPCFSISIRN